MSEDGEDEFLEPLTLEELTVAADELTGQLGELSEILVDVVEEIKATPGGPWLWHMLPPLSGAELARELSGWVSWLHERYLRNISVEEFRLPQCWYRHPVAVEELTALMVAHQAAYSESARKKSAELAYWHELHLWPCLRRLNVDLRLFDQCKKTHTEMVRKPKAHENRLELVKWADSFLSDQVDES